MKTNGKAGLTHRTPEEHEDECEGLLPWRQHTQIDGSETGHSCRADADEKGVRVRYVVFAIRSVEDGRENEGNEGAEGESMVNRCFFR